MPNLKLRKLPNCGILSAMLTAQDSWHGRQLRRGSAGLAENVGLQIEFPPSADELKVSYFGVETTQARAVLAKFPEGPAWAMRSCVDRMEPAT